MARARLQPGTLREFVSRHLELSNEQLAAKATEAGFKKVDVRGAGRVRYVLGKMYGLKAGTKGSALVRVKRGPYKARIVKEKNGVAPARQLKHGALRKLIFELGFDEVRDIFDEFKQMHERMGG